MSKTKLASNRNIAVGDTGNLSDILRKSGYYSGHQRWPRIKSYNKIIDDVVILAKMDFGGDRHLAKEEIRRRRHESMEKSGWTKIFQ